MVRTRKRAAAEASEADSWLGHTVGAAGDGGDHPRREAKKPRRRTAKPEAAEPEGEQEVGVDGGGDGVGQDGDGQDDMEILLRDCQQDPAFAVEKLLHRLVRFLGLWTFHAMSSSRDFPLILGKRRC